MKQPTMLNLRAFIAEDEPYLVDYLNDVEVCHFLSSKIPHPYTNKDAQWWITEGSQQGFTFAIEIEGVLAGCIGASPGEYEYCKSAEVGYWLARQYWGHGYASVALQQLIKKVQNSDIARLFATVFDGNDKSVNVLTKSGFVQEGRFEKAVFKNERFYTALVLSKLLTDK